MSKIWCEWQGRKNFSSDLDTLLREHDFAIIAFRYNHDIGGMEDDSEAAGKKRKGSDDQFLYSGEQSKFSREQYDPENDQLLHSRSMSRRQPLAEAERMCIICHQPMLGGKDVAALLNSKTEQLACSSTNFTKGFHVFHISCLIHWILLCEYESLTKESETIESEETINSVHCPNCGGTGMDIQGDELESPHVLAEKVVYGHKIKLTHARHAWMGSAQILEICSTGLHFPSQSGEIVQGEVLPLKSIFFYRPTQ